MTIPFVPHGSLRFEAGALVRRQIIRRIRDLAFRHDITLAVDEDKGWLDSHFVVKFEGEADSVRRFSNDVADFFTRAELVLGEDS